MAAKIPDSSQSTDARLGGWFASGPSAQDAPVSLHQFKYVRLQFIDNNIDDGDTFDLVDSGIGGPDVGIVCAAWEPYAQSKVNAVGLGYTIGGQQIEFETVSVSNRVGYLHLWITG